MKTKLFGILISIVLTLVSCGSKNGIDTDMIPVKMDGRVLFLNAKGEIKLENENASHAFFEGLSLYQEGGKYGYMNKEGKTSIEPQYKDASSFSEGVAWVNKVGTPPIAINKSGKDLFTLEQAQMVNSFSDGLAIFETYDKEGNTLYGCVNKSGKIVIEPQVNRIYSFSEGMAVIRDDDSYKKGYVNKSGEIVINCQFDEAEDFYSTGLACVKFGNKWGIINLKGEYVINPQFDKIIPDGDWFLIADNNKIGWCDKSGKYIINPQFESALPFNGNNLAPVSEGKKWGYCDKKGLVQLSYQFDGAFSFMNNETAIVVLNKKAGIINNEGKYIVNPQYDGIDNKYLEYIITGKTSSTLYSDYFNTEEIVAKIKELIKDNEIYGIPLNATVSGIMNKFKLSQSSFPKRETSIQLAKSKITPDVDIKFFTYGMPWAREKQGWFSSYIFKPEYQPESYKIVLELSWRKSDKTDQLAEELFDSLGGNFMPDINETIESEKQNPNYQLYITTSDKTISLDVTPIRP